MADISLVGHSSGFHNRVGTLQQPITKFKEAFSTAHGVIAAEMF
jgi:hypothetical protein